MLDKSNVLLFDNSIKINNIADNTQNEVLKDHMNKAQIELTKEFHPYIIREFPMDKIEIDVKYRQTVKKSSETQVYRIDKYNDLMAQAL